jgi:hypothetical protein
MKKALLTTLALAVVTGALAQGTVVFNNNTGSGSTRVYLPDPLNPGVQRVGNTSAQNPPGTQVYTGFSLVTGNGYKAELFALPGNVLPAGPFGAHGAPSSDSMVAGTPTTTFRTGSAAGIIAQVTATLGNVPKDAAAAVLQMRVYPASFANWGAALAAWQANTPNVFIGASNPFVVNTIGGDVNTPPNLPGLLSFSLVAAPEPSSFALAGMGLASLLIFRRRK